MHAEDTFTNYAEMIGIKIILKDSTDPKKFENGLCHLSEYRPIWKLKV